MRMLFLVLLLCSVNSWAGGNKDRNPQEQEYGTLYGNPENETSTFCTPWVPSGFHCAIETGGTVPAWERTCTHYLGVLEFCSQSDPNMLKTVCSDWQTSYRSSCPDGKPLKYRHCQDVRYAATLCE